MKLRFYLLILAFLFSLLMDFTSLTYASDLAIGRMRVSLWPEYDDPGILGIYDGRFVDNGDFPAETTFFLPKGAIISDACSLSPKGQHFCQQFKQEDEGDVSKVFLKLPFPNFYLSFHYKPFEGKGPLRQFNYDLKTNHEIRKLEIEIQEPLRAKEFVIGPPKLELENNKENKKGFNHYLYTFMNPLKGGIIPFKISYKKEDNMPSVDIKYSRMSGPSSLASPHEERGKFLAIIYTLAGAGFLLFSIMVYYLLKKKKQA